MSEYIRLGSARKFYFLLHHKRREKKVFLYLSFTLFPHEKLAKSFMGKIYYFRVTRAFIGIILIVLENKYL